MIGRRVLFGMVAGWSMILSAEAEPLTCTTFKDRLSGALIAAGDAETEMPAYQDARTTSENGSHSNWKTPTLSGSLSCGPADRFQEFYVSLNLTSREQFVDQLKRLVTLDGAAICTLASASPAACADTGKALLQDALQQMGSGFKRRVTHPSGLSARMIWPEIKAELTAAPSLITFSLAASEGMTTDAARRPLPAVAAAQKPGP